MTTRHDVRFPGESIEYREARNALLDAELALRRQIEKVAEMRRALPPGGNLKQDYVFDAGPADGSGGSVRFSDLFAPGRDSLVIYNFMYAPSAGHPCPMCTAFIDSLDGAVRHLERRINIALVAKAPYDRLADLAKSRGWTHIRLLSSLSNEFNCDYNAEQSQDVQRPVMSVFTRSDDGIRHTYSTELLFLPPDEGQNHRHIDTMWPLWNVLDLVPEGRGTDWYPSLDYSAAMTEAD
ncbi:DUF899 family protein [Roseibium sp. AS2]|uniref:DUF899 family protein n=1 Tax=Roseibium sp. AS2 TaxID=3135781 RepID=UPI00318098E6